MSKTDKETIVEDYRLSAQEGLTIVLKRSISEKVPLLISLGIIFFLKGILSPKLIFSLSFFIFGFAGVLRIITRHNVASGFSSINEKLETMISTMFTLFLWGVALYILVN